MPAARMPSGWAAQLRVRLLAHCAGSDGGSAAAHLAAGIGRAVCQGVVALRAAEPGLHQRALRPRPCEAVKTTCNTPAA